MFRRTLVRIIRQEQEEVEAEISREVQCGSPDAGRLVALRRTAQDLGRELEHYAPTGSAP